MFRVSPFDKVLVSPALRCIQTASAIVRRFKSDVSLCVEPGLFDWMRWYDILPKLVERVFKACWERVQFVQQAAV